MKRQSLIILSILAIGSIGAVYATTISNTGINTPNLTVTGTCTGCGGEADYTIYNLDFNGTTIGSDGSTIKNILIDNNGSLLSYSGGNNATIVNPSHAVIGVANADTGSNVGPFQYGISATGKYKIITTDSGGNHFIQIFKDNILLTTKTIDVTQFSGGSLTNCAVNISANGQYIIIYGPDSIIFTLDREVVIKGS